MSIELTILCDNSVEARPGLIGEHGFACHISTAGRSYLFDTGSGLGLLNNARACGIDLAGLDAVLLSHGHWDHCGGLIPLLKLRSTSLPIYAHPNLFSERISIRDDAEADAGSGFTRDEAESHGAVFHLSDQPVELAEGLLFSGEVPRLYPQAPDAGLFCRHEGELQPDQLPDDQSLYLQTDRGISILCGCAHAGVRNIIAHALSLSDSAKLYGLIGGLHLLFTDSEQDDRLEKDLALYDIQLLALSHCTGARAVSRLMGLFHERVTYAAAGRSFTI